MTTFRLALSDVECVDQEGLSIPQIVDRRLNNGEIDDDDFVQAFGDFLGSIRTEERSENGPELEEDEEFHDALEQAIDI